MNSSSMTLLQPGLGESNPSTEDLFQLVAHELVQVVAHELVQGFTGLSWGAQSQPVDCPLPGSIVDLVEKTRQILFPAYLGHNDPPDRDLKKTIAKELEALYTLASEQISSSFNLEGRSNGRSHLIHREQAAGKAAAFLQSLPHTHSLLLKDIQAAFEGDPAAKSFTEIVVCYPGFLAITVYRLAHTLHGLGIPLLPRRMTEYAHSLTGIDIHPGARIGEFFFIDHGTGVVIGETTVIGDRVRIYQGVTLGALSLPRDAGSLYRNKKRHPTIEDDVIVYANTTILGGDTTIGARSVIGGNVWITASVPQDTRVILKKPDLIFC
jgi:serine O-acetyltransferase